MAVPLLKISLHTVNNGDHSLQLHSSSSSLPLPAKCRPIPLAIRSSLPSPSPPASKEEAILQAKTSLSNTLQKPLNNPKLPGKLKKLKQPRFRVEIPVSDDSPAALSQLALQVFGEMLLKTRGSPAKILILWPNPESAAAAARAFDSRASALVEHSDIASVEARALSSAEVAVVLAPGASQLGTIETVSDGFFPKPMVIFNPRWGFDEESSFDELGRFVESFEVVYSFTGLEVRGVFSKRKGAIFKCVRDGVLSGERWVVLVEEDEGELKVVSSFKDRPSIGQVENVLYNLMAINSPITKSAKFLKDLVSNVTGRK